MTKYTYNGPVTSFDTLIANNWKGATMAKTEKKHEVISHINLKKATTCYRAQKLSSPEKLSLLNLHERSSHGRI